MNQVDTAFTFVADAERELSLVGSAQRFLAIR